MEQRIEDENDGDIRGFLSKKYNYAPVYTENKFVVFDEDDEDYGLVGFQKIDQTVFYPVEMKCANDEQDENVTRYKLFQDFLANFESDFNEEDLDIDEEVKRSGIIGLENPGDISFDAVECIEKFDQFFEKEEVEIVEKKSTESKEKVKTGLVKKSVNFSNQDPEEKEVFDPIAFYQQTEMLKSMNIVSNDQEEIPKKKSVRNRKIPKKYLLWKLSIPQSSTLVTKYQKDRYWITYPL